MDLLSILTFLGISIGFFMYRTGGGVKWLPHGLKSWGIILVGFFMVMAIAWGGYGYEVQTIIPVFLAMALVLTGETQGVSTTFLGPDAPTPKKWDGVNKKFLNEEEWDRFNKWAIRLFGHSGEDRVGNTVYWVSLAFQCIIPYALLGYAVGGQFGALTGILAASGNPLYFKLALLFDGKTWAVVYDEDGHRIGGGMEWIGGTVRGAALALVVVGWASF